MPEGFLGAVSTIQKKYGETAMRQLGDGYRERLPTVPTGSLALDAALGIGGLAMGRIHEIYGPESAGKTTICQHVIANGQRMGYPTAFIDMEHALDPIYAKLCGVDVDKMYLAQPMTGEEALDHVDIICHAKEPAVIVIDSVAALVPRAEIEGDMGDSHMGLQARLMSQALRKLSGIVKESGSLVLFTNQLRMKIGVVFGNPEVTTGGNALKFYASTRMDIRRVETQKSDGVPTGNRTKVRVTKNKLAPPYRVAEFDIKFGSGIDRESELLDMGVLHEIITKRGSWYSMGDLKLGGSHEKAVLYLHETPDLAQSLEITLREKIDQSIPDVTQIEGEAEVDLEE